MCACLIFGTKRKLLFTKSIAKWINIVHVIFLITNYYANYIHRYVLIFKRFERYTKEEALD